MAVYGPGCQPQNIIWTEGDRPVHKLPFGPKCHELFGILANLSSKTKNEFRQNPEVNIIWTGPSQYTVIWTGSLTKTNRGNINLKYNIFIYVHI